MRIVVFEENGSKKNKVDGLLRYGIDLNVRVISIEGALPLFIDEPENYIQDSFAADLVLNYLSHPDLSDYLILLCARRAISVIAPGKKSEKAITPFTCCGLGRHQKLGEYGRIFGFPEYAVKLEGERIAAITVLRGAPCAATWDALDQVVGCTVEEALSLVPRAVQYRCTADPASFDPVTGKSPVHYAGYVHRAALQQAVDRARRDIT